MLQLWYQTNTQSMVNKIWSFSRLNESISDQDVKVQGYDIIRRDRSTNGRFGGGVCFYIRSNISYSVRTDLDSQLLEIISIEIRKHNSKPFVITSWYRPPNSPMNFRACKHIIRQIRF